MITQIHTIIILTLNAHIRSDQLTNTIHTTIYIKTNYTFSHKIYYNWLPSYGSNLKTGQLTGYSVKLHTISAVCS